MGHFQLFSMILKFSMGHFLSFYTDFYGPFSKLMGLWRMAPCLPNHCIIYKNIKHYHRNTYSIGVVKPVYGIQTFPLTAKAELSKGQSFKKNCK